MSWLSFSNKILLFVHHSAASLSMLLRRPRRITSVRMDCHSCVISLSLHHPSIFIEPWCTRNNNCFFLLYKRHLCLLRMLSCRLQSWGEYLRGAQSHFHRRERAQHLSAPVLIVKADEYLRCEILS